MLTYRTSALRKEDAPVGCDEMCRCTLARTIPCQAHIRGLLARRRYRRWTCAMFDRCYIATGCRFLNIFHVLLLASLITKSTYLKLVTVLLCCGFEDIAQLEPDLCGTTAAFWSRTPSSPVRSCIQLHSPSSWQQECHSCSKLWYWRLQSLDLGSGFRDLCAIGCLLWQMSRQVPKRAHNYCIPCETQRSMERCFRATARLQDRRGYRLASDSSAGLCMAGLTFTFASFCVPFLVCTSRFQQDTRGHICILWAAWMPLELLSPRCWARSMAARKLCALVTFGDALRIFKQHNWPAIVFSIKR